MNAYWVRNKETYNNGFEPFSNLFCSQSSDSVLAGTLHIEDTNVLPDTQARQSEARPYDGEGVASLTQKTKVTVNEKSYSRRLQNPNSTSEEQSLPPSRRIHTKLNDGYAFTDQTRTTLKRHKSIPADQGESVIITDETVKCSSSAEVHVEGTNTMLADVHVKEVKDGKQRWPIRLSIPWPTKKVHSYSKASDTIASSFITHTNHHSSAPQFVSTEQSKPTRRTSLLFSIRRQSAAKTRDRGKEKGQRRHVISGSTIKICSTYGCSGMLTMPSQQSLSKTKKVKNKRYVLPRALSVPDAASIENSKVDSVILPTMSDRTNSVCYECCLKSTADDPDVADDNFRHAFRRESVSYPDMRASFINHSSPATISEHEKTSNYRPSAQSKQDKGRPHSVPTFSTMSSIFSNRVEVDSDTSSMHPPVTRSSQQFVITPSSQSSNTPSQTNVSHKDKLVTDMIDRSFILSASVGMFNNTPCSVCGLVIKREGEALFMASCGHIYHWGCAIKDKPSGAMPSCFVCTAFPFKLEQYCKLDLNREKADALLLMDGREGSFLLRSSGSMRGAKFTISFLTKGESRHCRVYTTQRGTFALTPLREFSSLDELFFYYYCNSFVSSENGKMLTWRFKQPCKGIQGYRDIANIVKMIDRMDIMLHESEG
eukprot:CFRG1472T1